MAQGEVQDRGKGPGREVERDVEAAGARELDVPVAQVVCVPAGERSAPVLAGEDRRILSRASQLDRRGGESASGRNVLEPGEIILVHRGDNVWVARGNVIQFERVLRHVVELERKGFGSGDGLAAQQLVGL